MAIKKISTYQNGSFSTQNIGLDNSNVSMAGASIGDVAVVGKNGTTNVIGYNHGVDISKLTGLTGNIQQQINALVNSGGGEEENIITAPNTVNLNLSNLSQNITISQSGDSNLIFLLLNENVITFEHINGDNYQITGIFPGETKIIIIAPTTSNYKGDIKIINVNFSSTGQISSVLNNNSWRVISIISQLGIADSYWDIGDKKKIILNGQVGDYCNLDNFETYVFILHFNHDSAYPGITFGTFKTQDGKDIALCPSKTGESTDGSKAFNIVHRGGANGGYNSIWPGTDIRYDILGSTDVMPQGYNTARSNTGTTYKGYDPTPTCTSNPVANTLMAVLPSDLRAVMKPFSIMSCLDFLPLPQAFSITGNTQGWEYSINYTPKGDQYQYYKNGNSKVKYSSNNLSSKCYYWTINHFTSSGAGGDTTRQKQFLAIDSYGSSTLIVNSYSMGIAPVFLV